MEVSEGIFNAALAGEFGVPVAFAVHIVMSLATAQRAKRTVVEGAVRQP